MINRKSSVAAFERKVPENQHELTNKSFIKLYQRTTDEGKHITTSALTSFLVFTLLRRIHYTPSTQIGLLQLAANYGRSEQEEVQLMTNETTGERRKK